MTMAKKTYDRMDFYTIGQLGKSRRTTPEGFLVCEGVAIARTGTQTYASHELPILEAGPSGFVQIERLPEEVFREETIASFQGKPVTINHPGSFVSPDTWRDLAVGVVQNVRRGTGDERDLLLADLMITRSDAIEHVNKNMPELSSGYEAEYDQTDIGAGIQRTILGNHVALVQRGRAGPRCAIKDHSESEKAAMADKKKFKLGDVMAALMKAFKSNDQVTIDKQLELVKEWEDDAPAAVTPTKATTKDGDDDDKDEKWNKMCDQMSRLTDSVGQVLTAIKSNGFAGSQKIEPQALPKDVEQGVVWSGDSMKELISAAEILSPGISIPTGDQLKTADHAEGVMRKVLQTVVTTDAGKELVNPLLFGRPLDTLKGDSLHTVFKGASQIARIKNNDKARVRTHVGDFGKNTKTAAEINELNRNFWAKQAGK